MDNTCPVVFVVDDDPILRKAMSLFLSSEELTVEAYDNAMTFLDSYRKEQMEMICRSDY